ncbi:hypothetical protein BSNK01_06410 [Bacillaceae bacterium]
MYWIVWVIISLIAWWGMDRLLKAKPGWGGWVSSLIVSLIGALLGDLLLGDWWWMLAGYNVIAGLLGAVVLTWVWRYVTSR